MRTSHLSMYNGGPTHGDDLAGYAVEALDGAIGSVEGAIPEVVGIYLVVDGNSWISGKKVVLPGAVIERVDADRRIVFVNRTCEQIKNAPDYHALTVRTRGYRAELRRYYGSEGAGSGFTPAPESQDRLERRSGR
jgi:hypothetical protein